MSECTHDCSTCSSNCASKQPESLIEPLNEYSTVKKVIGIISGKGGVGKSLVTSLLASKMKKEGFDTAILDADITGPSIPKAFGIKDKAQGDAAGLIPVMSDGGVKVMSTNLLLPEETDPVVWNDVDYMFVDMPPGTGDVALTVFQSLPIDGIIIVTSPQDLVSMIVGKAVKMAYLMNVPVLGLVENYSYLECPDCGKKIEVFGKSKLEEVAKEYSLKILGRLPINPEFAAKCDEGKVEEIETDLLDEAIKAIENA